MRIDVLTLFPDLFTPFRSEGLIGKAVAENILDIQVHNIRDAATDRHKTVDDAPYGGGAGMVMMAEPIFATVERVEPPRPIFFLGPRGKTLTQPFAEELAETSGFTLLCGRYEGVDQRVIDHLVDDELSIGDYVLNGGEVAAMVVIESVSRLLPDMMGNAESHAEESFSHGLLEYPQYTRPAEFRGHVVPDVLRSGNHQLVADWQLAQSLAITVQKRPDLIEQRGGITHAEFEVVSRHAPDVVDEAAQYLQP